MKKQIKIPKGHETVDIRVSRHTYVRLLDATGVETFRFDSPGEHVTAVVQPGSYTVDTDGRLGKIESKSGSPRLQSRGGGDSTRPPILNG